MQNCIARMMDRVRMIGYATVVGLWLSGLTDTFSGYYPRDFRFPDEWRAPAQTWFRGFPVRGSQRCRSSSDEDMSTRSGESPSGLIAKASSPRTEAAGGYLDQEPLLWVNTVSACSKAAASIKDTNTPFQSNCHTYPQHQSSPLGPRSSRS